jgi:hypothetical protein
MWHWRNKETFSLSNISLLAHFALMTYSMTSHFSRLYLTNWRSFDSKFKMSYRYCCTVHFEDSLSITQQRMHIKFITLKHLKTLLHISILRSSSDSTYCSLLKLHVKIVNMSLYLSVMWQHILCLCVDCVRHSGVCRLVCISPALKTTHTQTQDMLPHHW